MNNALVMKLAEDRRLIILRVLLEQPSRSLSDGVLQDALDVFGHQVSLDLVHGELAWLGEQGLVGLQCDTIWIASLTQRGSDVAQGRSNHPGVKQPAL